LQLAVNCDPVFVIWLQDGWPKSERIVPNDCLILNERCIPNPSNGIQVCQTKSHRLTQLGQLEGHLG